MKFDAVRNKCAGLKGKFLVAISDEKVLCCGVLCRIGQVSHKGI